MVALVTCRYLEAEQLVHSLLCFIWRQLMQRDGGTTTYKHLKMIDLHSRRNQLLGMVVISCLKGMFG